MRTTLNLEDDVLRAIRSLANASGESLGAVASRLIREALHPPVRLEYADDFPVFTVREGAAPLTPEMVRDAQDDP